MNKMIVDENITSYIHSLERDNSNFFEDMRCYAEGEDVPIIKRETESLLRILLMIKQPEKILEIGAGIAYSAIFMADCCEATITTIENYDKRIKIAKKYIDDAGLKERILLIEDDAKNYLSNIKEEFDFIFLDAAKAQYIEMLPDIIRILPEGGILLADNVLQGGDIIKSRFITERRQRTIHERMREFLYEIKHNEKLESTIITLGDGVALCVKK